VNAAVERETGALGTAAALPPAIPLAAPNAIAFDPDLDAEPRLPGDHPAWARDVVSLSQRAREMFARLRPVAVRIYTAWEHRVRSIFVAGRRLSVDQAGCYRVD